MQDSYVTLPAPIEDFVRADDLPTGVPGGQPRQASGVS